MAMAAGELKKWLSHLNDEDQICIDDGGLALQLVDVPDIYIEVGGDPGYDEDED